MMNGRLERGQALAEYALIASLLIFSLVATLSAVGPVISNIFTATVYELVGQVTPRPTLGRTEFYATVTALATRTPPGSTPVTNTPAGSPAPTDTPSPSPTGGGNPTPTATNTPIQPTNTPTFTPTPTLIPTNTPTFTPTPYYVRLEAEDAQIWGNILQIGDQQLAQQFVPGVVVSQCHFVYSEDMNRRRYRTRNLPGGMIFTFTVPERRRYYVFAAFYGPDGDSNSFYFRVDNNSWRSWHFPSGYPHWRYRSLGRLSPGQHTIEFAVREDGSSLDVIEIVTTSRHTPPPVYCQ